MPFEKSEETKFDNETIIRDYVNGLSLIGVVEKHGISMSNAYNILCMAGVMRTPSEAQFKKYFHEKDWHKLTPIGKTQTRVISIPTRFFHMIGVDPSDDLVGKWHAVDKVLLLEVRKR